MTKDEALRTALQNLLQATRHLDVCPGTVEAAEEALAQPVRPQNCKSGHCSCIECVMEPEQERHFCHRCGKRIYGLFGNETVHTCTPPRTRKFDNNGFILK